MQYDSFALSSLLGKLDVKWFENATTTEMAKPRVLQTLLPMRRWYKIGKKSKIFVNYKDKIYHGVKNNNDVIALLDSPMYFRNILEFFVHLVATDVEPISVLEHPDLYCLAHFEIVRHINKEPLLTANITEFDVVRSVGTRYLNLMRNNETTIVMVPDDFAAYIDVPFASGLDLFNKKNVKVLPFKVVYSGKYFITVAMGDNVYAKVCECKLSLEQLLYFKVLNLI